MSSSPARALRRRRLRDADCEVLRDLEGRTRGGRESSLSESEHAPLRLDDEDETPCRREAGDSRPSYPDPPICVLLSAAAISWLSDCAMMVGLEFGDDDNRALVAEPCLS